MIEADKIETFSEGLDHPEGVAVHPDGSVWAGGEAGQIYRISAEGGPPEEIVRVNDGFILGIAFSPDTSWLAICDSKQHCVHRLELKTRQLSVLTRGTSEHPLQIPNYPAFRSNGELFVSESGSLTGCSGLILRISSGGSTNIWHAGPFQFANGIAFSPDEKFLYLVESFGRPGVLRIAINSDGTAGGVERFSELARSVPDGLAFDASGTLYVTCYSPSRIYSLDPSGMPEIFAEDWTGHALSNCTNIAFGGKDFCDLYISNLGRWHIARIHTDRTGHRLPCHRLTQLESAIR